MHEKAHVRGQSERMGFLLLPCGFGGNLIQVIDLVASTFCHCAI